MAKTIVYAEHPDKAGTPELGAWICWEETEDDTEMRAWAEARGMSEVDLAAFLLDKPIPGSPADPCFHLPDWFMGQGDG